MAGSTIQRAFSAGEISSTLYGRGDNVKYQTGLRTCRNFIVLRHGGVSNRTGSGFVEEVNDSTARTYLRKFVFSGDQSYVIEIGNLYFRFYTNGARIEVASVPVEVVTPYITADLPALQFEQQGDVLTITHVNYQPRELARISDTSWTLSLVVTAPSIAAPANLVATEGIAGSLVYSYKVSAVKAETYEESEPSVEDTATCAIPNVSAPNTLAWDVVSGAVEYRVYLDKEANGKYGFLGLAASNSFNDPGIEPDLSRAPVVPRVLFAATDDYPATSTHHQQRRIYAGSNNEPETARASRTGFYSNFTITSPIQDDDAVTFTIPKSMEIRHLVELESLAVLGRGGIWTIEGDQDGALTPTAQYPKRRSRYKVSTVPPVVIGSTIIFVQDRGQIVRDLSLDPQRGYPSNELTLFSSHLVDRYSIERIDFAEAPHSIAWMIRNDGTLLGMTYLPEQEVIGWHRHDTGSGDLYEDVCVVPEGSEDSVYVVVKRNIGGATRRYIERFASRRFTDIRVDALFLDSYLTYDGRNAGAETVVFSGAGWTVDDEITVTRSVGTFVAGDVGNAVVLLNEDGVEIMRVVIGTYTSATVAKGYPDKTVPEENRNAATTDWALAVDQLSNLGHLEGMTVGIFADGNVLAEDTVSAGGITLPRPYSVIHVGIPIEADFETLDLDSVQASIRDKRKNISSINVLVEHSRGIFAGMDAAHLIEAKPTGIGYNTGPSLVTDLIEIPIQSTWRASGRFMIRQSDPVPVTILSVIPHGEMGN